MQAKTRFCKKPFTSLGCYTYCIATCCPVWFDQFDHVRYQGTAWEIWNCDALVSLRESILDGSYVYCQQCPYSSATDSALPDYAAFMKLPPTTLNVSYDTTCNLRCVMCPQWRSPAATSVIKQQEQIIDGIWREFGGRVDRLCLSSGGDVFASPTYRRFLQSITPSPHLKISLLTNGLLLPKYWGDIKHLSNNVVELSISIDAATQDTYEKIRRGGRWNDLIKSLDMVKNLDIQIVNFNFVVMACNYREIPQFVELSQRYGGQPLFAPMIVNEWNKSEALQIRHYEELLQYPELNQQNGRPLFEQAYHDIKKGVKNWLKC